MIVLPNRVRDVAISWGCCAAGSFLGEQVLKELMPYLPSPLISAVAVGTGVFACRQALQSNMRFAAYALAWVVPPVVENLLLRVNTTALPLLLGVSIAAALAAKWLTKDKDSGLFGLTTVPTALATPALASRLLRTELPTPDPAD